LTTLSPGRKQKYSDTDERRPGDDLSMGKRILEVPFTARRSDGWRRTLIFE
jgi:hypothetical protein